MSTPEPTPSATPEADEVPVAETTMTLEVESFELSGLETVPFEEERSLLARVGAETFGSFAFVLVTVG
ncbi:hypothetical protein, partial [Actinotalea sp.]|uniref:hypothetical protein n=1 Tax=Actinotalea sp. TaxID=1872145 RepID=UPI00356675E6